MCGRYDTCVPVRKHVHGIIREIFLFRPNLLDQYLWLCAAEFIFRLDLMFQRKSKSYKNNLVFLKNWCLNLQSAVTQNL